MNFMIAGYSDAGIKKHVNQYALLIKTAQTDIGRVCFSVLCDGMGGLSKGELASAEVIREMANWFEKVLPESIEKGLDLYGLRFQWGNIVSKQNIRLRQYAEKRGERMGTTAVVLLIAGGKYYIMNVGDSRVYMLAESLNLLTKDHTFVQCELDNGRMTKKEADMHPQRHVLLQCIGASEYVVPDFFEGDVEENIVLLLCSDGFHHMITEEEIYEKLNPYVLSNEQQMLENAACLIEMDKQRHETDNISVALIRTCREVDGCFK